MVSGVKSAIGDCQLGAVGRSMVEQNLRLCRFLAFRAARTCPPWIRPPLQDLYQEAYRGLIDAVIRFDERKSSRLGPYARMWIRKRLSEAMWRWRIVSVPTCQPVAQGHDHWERALKRRVTSLADDIESRAPAGAWPAEEIAELSEAIDRLPEPGRTVMRHRFGGASRCEIADLMGLTEFEVRRVLVEAMDQLRRWLDPSRGGRP